MVEVDGNSEKNIQRSDCQRGEEFYRVGSVNEEAGRKIVNLKTV